MKIIIGGIFVLCDGLAMLWRTGSMSETMAIILCWLEHIGIKLLGVR